MCKQFKQCPIHSSWVFLKKYLKLNFVHGKANQCLVIRILQNMQYVSVKCVVMKYKNGFCISKKHSNFVHF